MSSDDDLPTIDISPKPLTRKVAVDQIARARYLDVLARTGSHAAASVAAAPHLKTKTSAASTMSGHIKAHPSFAAQVQDVLASVAGKLDTEILDRALNGKVTYQKKDHHGKVVEEKIDYDNNLLLKVARQVGKQVDPGAWAPEDKRLIVQNNKSLDVHVSIDNILDGLDSDAIKNLIDATTKAKALGSGDQHAGIEEADIIA